MDKQKEWLRISGIPVEEAICEPLLPLAFVGRLIFAVPKLAPLWDIACGRKPADYPKQIGLLDGLLLHELVADHQHLSTWLNEMQANDNSPTLALRSPAFAASLDLMADRVNGILLVSELQPLIGRLERDRLDLLVSRLCRVFVFAEAWHMAMELFYRRAPESLLDTILLLCPDGEDILEGVA